jgi:carboxypeptidase Q
MNTLKSSVVALLIFIFPVCINSQNGNVDLNMIYKIKQEGLKNSQIEDMAFLFTDFAGPRLTGSTGNMKANELAKAEMEKLGFSNVRIDEAGIFRRGGWDNIKTYAAMTKPYYANFACNPVAWTGSTKGLVNSEVILLDVKSQSDLDKFKGRLSGKIILIPTNTSYSVNYEPLAKRLTDEQLRDLTKTTTSPTRRPDDSNAIEQRELRNKITAFAKNEGATAILNNSGIFNVPRSTGINYSAGDEEPIAELNIPIEDYSRMERLLRHNTYVEMEIEITNKFFPSPVIYNVIGEIPGTDKQLKDEIVLIGAHLDSWHGGTGAADNASGCIVMMEALRILKSIGVAPKRTIRIALWGGEEQGLYGSQGYVNKYLIDPLTGVHKPDYNKFSVYFNMDNGSGKYRGIYLQENEMARPVFEEWIKPFDNMGVTTIAIKNTTGTDHLSFDAAGLPGFQFIQDEIEYGRGYHTTMDTYERLVMNDLRYNAVVTAAFAYNAAMQSTKFPGKPESKPAESLQH